MKGMNQIHIHYTYKIQVFLTQLGLVLRVSYKPNFYFQKFQYFSF